MPNEKTVLYGLHAELGARFTPFAGYEMPIQYREGLRAEHLHTRSHAGLFDVSHMGQVRVTGRGLEEALERALPLDFDGWPEGVQRYSLLLNERGGIEEDVMVTRLPGEVRIVVNASCKEKDLELLRTLCPDLAFTLLDDALIALQGPAADAALPRARELAFMNAGTYPLARAECLVSRSGYTGEDGFEISVPRESAERLARELVANPEGKPVGLGARDTLRLEGRLHLYRQDQGATNTPLGTRLRWAHAPARRARRQEEGG